MINGRKGYIIAAVLMIFCLTATAAVLSGRLCLDVKAKDNTVRCYKQIVVEEGDSLWKIATEYMPKGYDVYDYMDEMKLLNHIDCDIIKAGYKLTVFYEQPGR